MIIIKSQDEVKKIRAAGKVVAATLDAIREAIVPGVSTTYDLEMAAMKVMEKYGASSPVLGYAPFGHPPYPARTCISVNDEVVHGIPGRRVLLDGDIVSCDVVVELNGYFGDSARTFPVGNITPEAAKLLQVTEEALYKGIGQVKVGARLGDVGAAIQRHAEHHGFSVVREMVGHGVGKFIHEDPQVPNYGKPHTGVVLKEGMTLAIEPMVNAGKRDIEALSDQWTIVTKDRKLSAHFEHTVVVTRNGAQILTQGD